MSLLDSLNGTGGMEEFDDQKHNVPWEKGSKFSYMNSTKKFILEKYPKAFNTIRISEVKGAPILIPRSTLMKKVEEIYNEQTLQLLRKKTKKVLNIAATTREYTRSIMKSNPTYFIQSLTNLVYSADKHGDHPETAQFLKFLVGPTGDDSLLFYLYIRQNFKILTHESFLNNRVSAKDPNTMDISYSMAVDIIDQAFYYDSTTRQTLKDAVRKKVQPKHRIRYYDFVMTLLRVKLSYSKLDMVKYLVMLYKVKGPNDNMENATMTRGFSTTKKERVMGHEEEEEAEFKDDMEIGGEQHKESVDGLFDDETETEEESTKGFRPGQGNAHANSPLDDHDDEEDLEESLYLEDRVMIRKYRPKFKKEDNDLQKAIRRLSTRVIQDYINLFIENNEVNEIGASKRQQTFDKVYNKIYNLNMVIFYTDQATFFELLRVGKKHKEANELWIEMNKQYLYMIELDEVDDELVIEFLESWLRHSLVQSNTRFYLEYEYQVPNPIIEQALLVETTVVVTRIVKKKRA